ncbi:MAG: bifunctional 4-hydroxy-2-oxoglutarate aldolase/2-dehydro-3-deoxy-phosphogluconate aldolase [Nocardioidaceae bacterium]
MQELTAERVPLPEMIDITGAVPVLRTRQTDHLVEVADVLVEHGLSCLEVTFTVPSAADWVGRLRKRYGDAATVGAGTVHDAQQAQAAIDAGAGFVVSAAHVPEVLALCQRLEVACLPGALTATEVWSCWAAGASAVKLFPASMLTPEGLSALRGPFPDIPLVPTGGVGIDDVAEWLRRGASAVGLGGPLLGDVFTTGDLDSLAANARRVAQAVTAARADRRTG